MLLLMQSNLINTLTTDETFACLVECAESVEGSTAKGPLKDLGKKFEGVVNSYIFQMNKE